MKVKVELIVELDTAHDIDLAELGDDLANAVLHGPTPSRVEDVIQATCTRVEAHN